MPNDFSIESIGFDFLAYYLKEEQEMIGQCEFI